MCLAFCSTTDLLSGVNYYLKTYTASNAAFFPLSTTLELTSFMKQPLLPTSCIMGYIY